LEDYHQINEELFLYNPSLANLPQIIVANKTDLPQSEEGVKVLRGELGEENVFPISAVTGNGVRELLFHVARVLNELPIPPEPVEQTARYTPTPDEDAVVTISKENNNLFILKGTKLEKLVAMTDFNNEDAVRRFQRLFRLWGHESALKDAGAKNGDTIKIRNVEFTFWQEEQ
jgi:GTP-binding protein